MVLFDAIANSIRITADNAKTIATANPQTTIPIKTIHTLPAYTPRTIEPSESSKKETSGAIQILEIGPTTKPTGFSAIGDGPNQVNSPSDSQVENMPFFNNIIFNPWFWIVVLGGLGVYLFLNKR